MNRLRIIIIFALVIALAVTGLLVASLILYKYKNKEYILKTNGGVPFRWEYSIEDESVIELSKNYSKSKWKYRNMSGAPVEIHYVFKGKKAGTTTIKFRYVSIIDDKVSIEEVHKVQVDKNLRIKEIK